MPGTREGWERGLEKRKMVGDGRMGRPNGIGENRDR
jgi:hypothetical protein